MFGDISQKLPGQTSITKLVTIGGDVSGNGYPPATITITLPTVNPNVGTFQGLTVNAKGQITAAANQSYLTANQTITLSGDLTGSGTTAIAGTLATVNGNVGTFGSTTNSVQVTVNAKGLITAISNQAISSGGNTNSDTIAYTYFGGM